MLSSLLAPRLQIMNTAQTTLIVCEETIFGLVSLIALTRQVNMLGVGLNSKFVMDDVSHTLARS